ncbi:MAG TPA: prephenate dehydratase [Cyclobacteriaceae bacterium]|nr:prephenate dehydratase [Cyclobacteriaceae bacterium]
MKSKRSKIAIQGIAASFHEVAAFTYFGQSIETIECLTFYDLCLSLKSGKADYAVMAIENSIAGSILPNYFLLQEYHFQIIGEIYLPIHMHLLALPGTKIGQVKTIESHPMAIRQCSDYLQRLNGQVEIRESADTALSAKKVSEKKLKGVAAIANEFAAKRFGLEIVEKRIETHKKNFTRFLILSRNNGSPADSNKASISFEVGDEVGSLAEALMTFKANNINLLKIQSIPVIGKPSEYSIHLDLEWKNRKKYETAMRAIMRQVRNLNILGEYKKGKLEYK